MKTEKTHLATLVLALILPLASLLCSCNPDTSHSATDGGNMKQLKNTANNSDTSSTPNVAADTTMTH